MKRNIVLGTIFSFIIISIGYSGASWWAGKSAEKAVQRQINWFKNQPYLIVKKQFYNRGWFSSEGITTLALHPDLYTFMLQKTSKNALPVFEVTYKQHITHGPLPLLSSFNFRPYKARVTSEVIFSPDIQKHLTGFFGKKKPLSMVEYIAFNNDSKAKVSVPSFVHEEPIAGINMKWGGLKGDMQYSGDLSSYFAFHGTVPNIFAEFKSKGYVNLNNLLMDIDRTRGKAGLMLGTSALSIDNLDINWLDKTPLHFTFNKMSYGAKISENGNYIDGEGTFGAQFFKIDTQNYGPIRFLGVVQHLYGPSLMALSKAIDNVYQKSINAPQSISDEALQQIFFQYGLPLLEHNPELGIREFFVKTPDGDINLTANVYLKNFEKKDLEQPVVLFSKIQANADISLPRQIVESIIAFQMQNGLNENQEGNNADMRMLIRQIVEGQINTLAQEKFIRVEGNNIITNVILKQGKLTLNGMPILMPWQQTAALSK